MIQTTVSLRRPERRRAVHWPRSTAVTAMSILSAALAYWARLPDKLHSLIVAVTIATIIDTVTGVWVAAVSKEMSSRSARERLITKVVQYTLFVCCGFLISMIANDFWIADAVLLAIFTLEILSMLENCRKLEKFGGVKFGYFSTFLDRLNNWMLPTGFVGGNDPAKKEEQDKEHEQRRDGS